MKRRIAVAAGIVLLAASVAGCNGTNHDSQNPVQDIQFRWVRVETPPSFQTIMFGCFGSTGMYLDQGDGNLSQVPNDPMCPISKVFDSAVQQKYGFRIVIRTNSQGAGSS